MTDAVRPGDAVPPIPPAQSTPPPAPRFSPSGYPTPTPQYGPASQYAPVPEYSPLTVSHGTGLNAPGVKSMLFGFGIALIGLVVTVGTYLFAPGNHFILLWGPVIFGTIAGVRGLITFLKS